MILRIKSDIGPSFLGHVNMTHFSDGKYVGSSTGLDEVNYKLQAFMELWKGLAHDVDDLYDKVISYVVK